MKILTIIILSFLMPALASAAVSCAGVVPAECSGSPAADCPSADSYLGQTSTSNDADSEAVD